MRIVFGSIEANQQLLKDAVASLSVMSDLLDGDLDLSDPSVIALLGYRSDNDDVNADATEILIASGIAAKIARHRIKRMTGKVDVLDSVDGSTMGVIQ